MPPRKRAAAKKAPAKKVAAKKTTARKAPAKKRAAPSAARQKAAKVLELRRGGMTFAAIAKKVGYRDPDLAHLAYEQALAEVLPRPVEEIRRLEVERIDQEMEPLWDLALEGDAAAVAKLLQLGNEKTRISATSAPLHLPVEHKMGPVEAATLAECQAMGRADHTLAVTALTLARGVDALELVEVGLGATGARELRMQMVQLRGLGAQKKDEGEGTPTSSVVVPQSRLAEIRAQHEAANGQGS